MKVHGMPGHMIRRMHQVSTQVFQSHMKQAGLDITQMQFAAMEALRDHPGIDQAGVATLIFCDRPTVGGVLDRLVAKGLVERMVNPKDRRARELRLTPAGDALFDGLVPMVVRLQEDILSNLTEAEREVFLALATKAVEGREGV